MEVALLGLTMSLTWFLAFITLDIFIIFALYDYYCHTYWKRRGVKHETPIPFIGTPLFMKGIPDIFIEYKKKFGKVYGAYTFREPTLVVGEADLVRLVTIKSFSKFQNRPALAEFPEELGLAVTVLGGERWKEVRNILTPTFSGAKMKGMSHLVNNSADNLVKHIGLKQKENGFIECKQLFGSFVMDTIGSCAFGLDVDSQSNPNSPFVVNAKKAFEFDFNNPFVVIGTIIPFLGKIMTKLGIMSIVPPQVLSFFRDVIKKAVQLRKVSTSTSKSKNVDFLQLLLDAQKQETISKVHRPEGGEDIDADLDKHHDMEYFSKGVGKKVAPLTDREVFAQTIVFFTAGFETTTTLLGFIGYALATNPEVQEKLIEEIDTVTPSRNSVGYTSFAKMPYLDQVVCETLRMYPPSAITNRICNETFEHKGIVIEKGVQVFIPTYTIHHDPDYWPEPEKFKPERFTKEARAKQHPLAWLPFGAGPRNCIGMRFALMETKTAVVRTLQNYRLATCPQTEIPPKFNKNGLLSPPNGVTLKAIPRTDKAA